LIPFLLGVLVGGILMMSIRWFMDDS